MSRPTEQEIMAAATVLATVWDADGRKVFHDAAFYREIGAGIADMVIHDPPPRTLVEYLGVLEKQLGLPRSTDAERRGWADALEASVRNQAGS
jgi:hypothetical protein